MNGNMKFFEMIHVKCICPIVEITFFWELPVCIKHQSMETSNTNRNGRKEITSFRYLVSLLGVKVDTLFLTTKTTKKYNGFQVTVEKTNTNVITLTNPNHNRKKWFDEQIRIPRNHL